MRTLEDAFNVVNPLPAVLLMSAMLLVTEAMAQPETQPWASGTRHLTLTPEPTVALTEVRISPGVGTLLLFDTQVARVELPGLERFGRLHLNGDLLTLVPAASLVEGETLLLTVHFADGAAPGSAAFRLMVHPALADRQVEVHRQPRTADALQAELLEREAEVRRLQAELARVLAAQAQPDGLAGLIVTELLGAQGVQVRVLDVVADHPRNALATQSVVTYHASRQVAVEARLNNARGADPWEAAGASLVAGDGTALRVLRVWQPAPLVPGKLGLLVVEAEAPKDLPPGPYTLKAWGKGGVRSITLSGLSFP